MWNVHVTLVVKDNRRRRSVRSHWAKKHTTCFRQQWASVLFTDGSRFVLESGLGRIRSVENKAFNNVTLLNDTVIEAVES